MSLAETPNPIGAEFVISTCDSHASMIDTLNPPQLQQSRREKHCQRPDQQVDFFTCLRLTSLPRFQSLAFISVANHIQHSTSTEQKKKILTPRATGRLHDVLTVLISATHFVAGHSRPHSPGASDRGPILPSNNSAFAPCETVRGIDMVNSAGR